MAYSKMGDSEKGRKDGKGRRERGRTGQGMWIMTDQSDITACSEGNGRGEVVEECAGGCRGKGKKKGKWKVSSCTGLFPKVNPVHCVSHANPQTPPRPHPPKPSGVWDFLCVCSSRREQQRLRSCCVHVPLGAIVWNVVWLQVLRETADYTHTRTHTYTHVHWTTGKKKKKKNFQPLIQQRTSQKNPIIVCGCYCWMASEYLRSVCWLLTSLALSDWYDKVIV